MSSSTQKNTKNTSQYKSVQDTPVDKQSSQDFFWSYFKAINVDCQDTAGLLSVFDSIKNTDYSINKNLDVGFLNALFKTCVTVHLDPDARRCLPSNEAILDFLEIDRLYNNRQPSREKSYDAVGKQIDEQIQYCLKNDEATARAAKLIQKKGAESLIRNPDVQPYVERAAAYHSANHPLCIDAEKNKKGGSVDSSKEVFQKNQRASQTVCRDETKAMMQCQNKVRENLENKYGSVTNALLAEAGQQQCFQPMQKMFWCNFSAMCAHPLQECIERRQHLSQGKVSDSAAFQQCFNTDRAFLQCTGRISQANHEHFKASSS